MKLLPLFVAFALALPAPFVSAMDTAFGDARRATDAELDAMRGGFEVQLNGLPFVVSFSLDKLTFLNGDLVASSRLSIESLTNAISVAFSGGGNTTSPVAPVASAHGVIPNSPPQSPGALPNVPQGATVPVQVTTAQVENVMNAVNVFQQGLTTVVQSGANNQSLADNIGSIATVIQNTLDNQVITNLTVVNARFSQAELEIAARLNAVNAFLIGR
jgi:hypothetical protein